LTPGESDRLPLRLSAGHEAEQDKDEESLQMTLPTGNASLPVTLSSGSLSVKLPAATIPVTLPTHGNAGLSITLATESGDALPMRLNASSSDLKLKLGSSCSTADGSKPTQTATGAMKAAHGEGGATAPRRNAGNSGGQRAADGDADVIMIRDGHKRRSFSGASRGVVDSPSSAASGSKRKGLAGGASGHVSKRVSPANSESAAVMMSSWSSLHPKVLSSAADGETLESDQDMRRQIAQLAAETNNSYGRIQEIGGNLWAEDLPEDKSTVDGIRFAAALVLRNLARGLGSKYAFAPYEELILDRVMSGAPEAAVLSAILSCM